MIFKKRVIILSAIFLFFSFVFPVLSNQPEIFEWRYYCRIESANPIWHILFFLFSAENREFLWREINGYDSEGHFFQEISLYNKKSRVIKFFYYKGNYQAEIDFGSKENSGVLNSNQAQVYFKILKFIRSALPGQKIQSFFQTAQNSFLITIEAQDKVLLEVNKIRLSAIAFRGEVRKISGDKEKFLDIYFWVADCGFLKGQIIKCSFKKTFWPTIILEIIFE